MTCLFNVAAVIAQLCLVVNDVNKTTSLKTYTKTNVIAADNVIIIGKVAIGVSLFFLQHNILYVFTVFHYLSLRCMHIR